jgi:ribokinase
MANNRVTIMGSYVADVAFRIDRLPTWGETRMGQSFQLGPGGKGSNQAVAAARAGVPGSLNVSFISKLGPDAFGEIARALYRAEGIDTQYIFSSRNPTGAAAILIDATRGENAIIVVPGACFELTPAEVDQATALIASSSIFVAQLELPLLTVECGLRLAHTHGVPTILNPPQPPPSPTASTLSATT